jgi:E3 SUMO-protein ligase RanBP2
MRREQIHKLVLNHAITEDFSINMMNNSPQAYCWGAMNHAEHPPAVEKLATRFKNESLADGFRKKVEECIDHLRKRAGLEPEED